MIRLPRVDYPLSDIFEWGDGTRDYLVANHILKFQEFPLTGPYNLLFDSGILSSPIYFYLLAMLLIPLNHILTLSIINIFLQIAVIYLIYLIGKKLFNPSVGLISAVFYSLSSQILKLSDFIWQPNLMQIFALSSLYLLLNADRNKRFNLLSSLILISLAFMIHYSAFPWVVICLIIAYLKTKNLKLLMVVPLVLVILYTPVISFYIGSNYLEKLNYHNFLNIFTINNFFSNLTSNLTELMMAYNVNVMLGVVILVIGSLLLYGQKRLDRATFLVLVLTLIPIIVASFFNKIRLHYLILSVSLLPILVAKLMDAAGYLKIPLILIIILIFSSNFSDLFNIEPAFKNRKLVSEVTDTIVDELYQIKEKDRFGDFSFFQILSYGLESQTFTYPILDTILLSPLEARLDTKLARVSDKSAYNHIQINRKDYLIVACYKFSSSGDCINLFQDQFNQYKLVKNIYNSNRVNVYLTKR